MSMLRQKLVSTSLTLGIVVLCMAGAGVALGYGEGPSDSGRWVYGKVTYSDGSKCTSCGPIIIDTENGQSVGGFTDKDAQYKVYVAGSRARTVYYHGSKKWTGDLPTKGGARVDITAP
ncbi:hypothetical protein L6R50_06630 [Myxococcota bacterium]|nr:hypothetical protein [Myxococcota bacterium]